MRWQGKNLTKKVRSEDHNLDIMTKNIPMENSNETEKNSWMMRYLIYQWVCDNLDQITN